MIAPAQPNLGVAQEGHFLSIEFDLDTVNGPGTGPSVTPVAPLEPVELLGTDNLGDFLDAPPPEGLVHLTAVVESISAIENGGLRGHKPPDGSPWGVYGSLVSDASDFYFTSGGKKSGKALFHFYSNARVLYQKESSRKKADGTFVHDSAYLTCGLRFSKRSAKDWIFHPGSI